MDRKAMLTEKSEKERALASMRSRLEEIETKDYQEPFMVEKVGLIRRISGHRNKIKELEGKIKTTWP